MFYAANDVIIPVMELKYLYIFYIYAFFSSSYLWPSCLQSSQHHPSSSSVVLLIQGPVALMGPGTFRPLVPLCERGRRGSS